MKLHWIFTGLAATVAILAVGFILSLRDTRGVASSAMAAAPAERPAVRALPQPGGLAFADRFAGAPLWETAYTTVRTETRTAYAPEQPSDQADRVAAAPAAPAQTFELASASATMVEPPAPSESRPRPSSIAGAVAAYSEPESRIAIYDIAAHTVYMPNGDKLEAHSGLGERLDNPRFVSAKNRGPTPPNVYKLSLRERVFHGVRAIRLTPLDESKMFGRDGMLAHTYMLRARGHSNGCVVFSNYPAFLNAFLRGEVDRMVVVDHLDAPPKSNAKVASAAP